MNHKKIILFSTIILLAFFAAAKNARAATVQAVSCNSADVLAAITSSADGDTISIPAGDCDWTAYSNSGMNVTGNRSIIGAGSGVNGTILRTTDGGTFFFWNPAYPPTTKSTFWRLSGIRFYSDLGCTASCQVSVGIQLRNSQNFRIDNNYFEGYFGPVIQWKSVSKGLLDHNTFINHNVANNGSYYGVSGGMPYDGGPPNPICHTVGNSSCLPRCDTEICACEAGEASSNRASSVSYGNTVVSSVPAVINNAVGSGTGKVRRIYINIAAADTGATINVASFSRAGNLFTARARTTNLAVKSGLNIFAVDDGEFTAFDINNGDYIGVYLNNCTLEAAVGVTGWTMSGDQTGQSSVDFSSPAIGAVSLYAELYDNENAFGACEQSWINWYNDTTIQREVTDIIYLLTLIGLTRKTPFTWKTILLIGTNPQLTQIGAAVHDLL